MSEKYKIYGKLKKKSGIPNIRRIGEKMMDTKYGELEKKIGIPNI